MLRSCVTTCVVVWIEICYQSVLCGTDKVTTCVVVWIEILALVPALVQVPCHHLRGGVD